MFAEEIRRAIPATPRGQLADLSAAVWKGFAAGAVSEHDAQALAEAIEARKAIPVAPPAERRRVGSRPRSSASMERRRRWTSSGWLPPTLGSRFTMAEAAVLAVLAAEVAKAGRCALALDHIAALAGVCRSTAKAAIREARALGLLTVEVRPDRPFRHLPNIIKIISPEWRSWISMRRSGQGVKSSAPTKVHKIQSKETRGRTKPLRDRPSHRGCPSPHFRLT